MALKGQPNSDLETAKALGKTVFPGISDYLTAQRPPPETTPNAAGKLPSSDPYLGPAISEAADTAKMAMPSGSNMLNAILGIGSAAAADKMAARSPSSTPTDTASPAPPGMVSIRPKFTQEDDTRLKKLDEDIKKLTSDKQNAINSVGRSRISATAESYDSQIKDKQAEAQRMRNEMLNRQSDYDKATLPLVASKPDLVAKGRLGMMGLSGLTGVVNALSGKSLPKSLLYGGLEGGFGVLAPNLYDLQQPAGTPAKEAADKNLRFLSHPDEPGAWNWARDTLGPEAVGGATLGTIGHGVGSSLRGLGGAVTSGVRGLFNKSPPANVPTSLPPVKTGKIYQDANGRWRQNGSFVKAPNP